MGQSVSSTWTWPPPPPSLVWTQSKMRLSEYINVDDTKALYLYSGIVLENIIKSTIKAYDSPRFLPSEKKLFITSPLFYRPNGVGQRVRRERRNSRPKGKVFAPLPIAFCFSLVLVTSGNLLVAFRIFWSQRSGWAQYMTCIHGVKHEIYIYVSNVSCTESNSPCVLH